MVDPTISPRVTGAWRDAVAAANAMPAGSWRPVAIGWATVELDRATSELAGALGLPRGEEAFRPAPRSAVLGGACRVAAGVLPDGGSLVVLEPDTEGRLAGSLARRGEGPVAVWFAAHSPEGAPQALGEAGFTVSAEQEGPLGTERLVMSGPTNATGQHRLLVARAAGTIPS
ncbi:MAG: hypothetical protein ACXW4H_01350 [Candidatus Limnocylindrales bacterium]